MHGRGRTPDAHPDTDLINPHPDEGKRPWIPHHGADDGRHHIGSYDPGEKRRDHEMKADERCERNGGATGEAPGQGIGRAGQTRQPLEHVLGRAPPAGPRPYRLADALAQVYFLAAPEHSLNISQRVSGGEANTAWIPGTWKDRPRPFSRAPVRPS